LNRIKKKPYVEKNDAPGRTDAVAAKDAWDEFQLRNQSIIVDLMYGQLKSKLTCLTCDNSSTVFDELLTIPLPLPE
jgi:ubiquitin C-terminal hydrolase